MMTKEKSLLREEQILLMIDKLGYASRSQLQHLFRLGTTRNAQRVLQNMGTYLNHFRHYDNVYYLNKKGREKIGSENVRQKPQQVDHVLLRNDVFIHYLPRSWKIEKPVMINQEPFIIPDVTFETKDGKFFLEVDNTQKMIENKKKVKTYMELQTIYHRNKKQMPLLLWITSTDHRREKLKEYCKQLNTQILTKEDLK